MNLSEVERKLLEECRKINAAAKAHRIQAQVNTMILGAGGSLAPRGRGDLLRQVYEQLLWKRDGHGRV